MCKISSNSVIIPESKHFTFDNGIYSTIVLFSENDVCSGSSRIRFSIVILCFWVLERCINELYKDCHRQMPKQTVWTHGLAITSQPKQAIFSHRKKWVILTGLKHHIIMLKKELSPSKSIVHSFHAVLWPMCDRKNDIPINWGQVLK